MQEYRKLPGTRVQSSPAQAGLVAALVGVVFLGTVFFGGINDLVRPLLASVVAALAGLHLWLARPNSVPGRALTAVGLLFPIWMVLQLVPLPLNWIEFLSSERAAAAIRWWPGPLHGCSGTQLLREKVSFCPLSIDPSATRESVLVAAACLAAFLAAHSFFASRPLARRRLFLAVTILAGAEAFYGLSQWGTQSPHVLWLEKISFLDCATGTLINRNHFALLLNLGLGCALSLILDGGGLTGAEPSRRTAPFFLLSMAAGLVAGGILASKSRSGCIGMLLILLSLVPTLFRQTRRRRVFFLAGLGLLVIPVLLVVGADLASRFGAMTTDWSQPAGRGAAIRAAWPIVGKFPVFGTGAGSFQYAFQIYQPANFVQGYVKAHNSYLELLIETGIPGFLFCLAPVVLAVAWAFNPPRRSGLIVTLPQKPWPLLLAFVAAALEEAVDFGLSLPALLFLLAILFGAALPPLAFQQRGASPIWPILSLFLAVTGLFHAAGKVPTLASRFGPLGAPQALFSQSFALTSPRSTGDPLAQLCPAIEIQAQAQAKASLDNYFAERHASLLVEALQSGRLSAPVRSLFGKEARRTIRRAATLNPNDVDTSSRLIQTALDLGDESLALSLTPSLLNAPPELVRESVRAFLDKGIPFEHLRPWTRQQPQVFGEIAAWLFEQNDTATLSLLIPPNARAEAGICRAPAVVSAVFRNQYKADPAPLLESCLTALSKDGNRGGLDGIRSALARAALEKKDFAAAGRWAAIIENPFTRGNLELDLAAARADWSGVIQLAWKILDAKRTQPLDKSYEARIRILLGKAYVRLAKFPAGLQQIQEARELEPMNPNLNRIIEELRQGRDPF